MSVQPPPKQIMPVEPTTSMVNSMTALAVALVIASAVNLHVAHTASLAPYTQLQWLA